MNYYERYVSHHMTNERCIKIRGLKQWAKGLLPGKFTPSQPQHNSSDLFILYGTNSNSSAANSRLHLICQMDIVILHIAFSASLDKSAYAVKSRSLRTTRTSTNAWTREFIHATTQSYLLRPLFRVVKKRDSIASESCIKNVLKSLDRRPVVTESLCGRRYAGTNDTDKHFQESTESALYVSKVVALHLRHSIHRRSIPDLVWLVDQNLPVINAEQRAQTGPRMHQEDRL